MKTKRITKLLMMGLLASTAAWCQFEIPGIPDIVWDPKTMAQVEQDIRAVKQLQKLYKDYQRSYDNATAMLKNSGGFKSAMSRATDGATAAINATSSGMDAKTAAMWKEALGVAKEASLGSLNSADSGISTGNSVLLAIMHMQAAETKAKNDQLQRHLDYADLVKQHEDAGEGRIRMSDSLQRVMR